jgi:hypothetical protein
MEFLNCRGKGKAPRGKIDRKKKGRGSLHPQPFTADTVVSQAWLFPLFLVIKLLDLARVSQVVALLA